MKLMGVDDLLRFVAAARPRTTRSIAGSLQATRPQRADPDFEGTRPLRTSDRLRQKETDRERAPRARGRPRPRRGTRIAPRRVAWLWIVLLASGAGAGCSGSHAQPPTTTRTNIHRITTNVNRAPAPPARRDVYAADRPGNLSPVVRGMPAYVYVPNSQSDTVDVIDQRTFRVIGQFPVGALPQHVTPSYDLKTPLGRQRHGQQPHADQPVDGQAGAAGPGRRPLQPVLHGRRPLRDRGCRAAQAA